MIDERIVQAAQQAAENLEDVKARGDRGNRSRLELHCAAMGLMVLAEIGGTRLEAYEGDRVAVDVGADAIVGWRRVEPYADLLRRLGWVREEDGERASYEPLAMVYRP